MGALSDVIKDPVRRRRVVDDGEQIIDLEVSEKSGLSGMAVKAGFKLLKGVRPNFVPIALDGLLDDFCAKVDPFWDAFKASGEKDARAYFARRGPEIAEALLAITDKRAEKHDNKTVRGAYYKLRPEASKHVVAAMPRVGDLVRRHVG